ncbi:hypothetical protein ACLQ2D_30365 [Streptomyces sp. DT199]|uniref:hypothetical protein n=1 Tax=Streptomyces sp. DT199 TaxID=3393421 RepID=UPI003CE7D8CA
MTGPPNPSQPGGGRRLPGLRAMGGRGPDRGGDDQPPPARRPSGEVITDEALDYLRSGAEHGVLIPVAADSSVRTLRVVARGAHTRG